MRLPLLALALVGAYLATVCEGHGGFQCFSCSGSATNEECNRHTQRCGSYYRACAVVVEESRGHGHRSKGRGKGKGGGSGSREHGGGSYVQITKSCASVCRYPGRRHCSRGRCTYCCVGDLCNEGLTYVPTRPAGPPGPPGAQGPAGPPGPPGARGSRGPSGPQGRPGPKGMKGDKGDKGDTGDRGPVGRPGADGMNGADGPTGPKGSRGAKGARGGRGPKGMTGANGPRGPRGLRGPKGPAGECDCHGGGGVYNAIVAFYANVSEVRTYSGPIRELELTNIHTNIGGSLNLTYARFTAPFTGTYIFHVTSSANGNGATPLLLYHNEVIVMTTGRTDADVVGPYPLGTNQAILYCEVGDVVALRVRSRRRGFISGVLNKFSSPSDISFSGFLLGRGGVHLPEPSV